MIPTDIEAFHLLGPVADILENKMICCAANLKDTAWIIQYAAACTTIHFIIVATTLSIVQLSGQKRLSFN